MGRRCDVLRRLGVALTIAGAAGCAAERPSSPSRASLEGPYLGQGSPGATARLFAPEVLETALFTRDVAMMPDGSEIYFGAVLGRYEVTTICVTRLVDGRWTPPEVASFATDPKVMNIEPAIAPDGSRLMFLSNRPGPNGQRNQDLWVVERQGDGWGDPANLGPPVNSAEAEFFPSLTADGTLYFTRTTADGDTAIYRSRRLDGGYAEPERLPAEVNSGRAQYNAFVAPDESYLIVPTAGREDSLGGEDYYVVFRDPDDTWTGPFNLGPEVNTPGSGEHSASVSPDGRALFFMSTRLPIRDAEPVQPLTWDRLIEAARGPGNGLAHLYWIDAEVLTGLRPGGSGTPIR